MLTVILICAAICAVMIASILFFPKIKIGKISLDTYWMVTVVGAIILLILRQADIVEVGKALVADNAVNPLKILILFISMTVLSVFLDEVGFFRYLANAVLKRAHSGQKKLFLYLYITVSVLTVFTSNDVIILSFTPFICYFAKNAKINATPFLAAEFVAANTWSMALIIGNPTNIYLASSYGLNFAEYLKISFIPTFFAGIVAFGVLYLSFRKKLSAPMQVTEDEVVIDDKLSLWVGIVHLAACTILLAISSYINLQMWLVALCAAISLMVISTIITLVRKNKFTHIVHTIKRIPYQLIPFVLSMFVMIVALEQNGVTAAIGNLLGEDLPILKYGITSFVAANLINNIPMSILFSSIIQTVGGNAAYPAVFATIIGSNMGAIFTPVGALAGIMWSSILNEHGLKFGYKEFLKMGVTIALPTLAASLLGLWLSLTIFA
jgi:arsenical pump membrane protein